MSTYGRIVRVSIAALAASCGCYAQNVTFGLSSGSAGPGSNVTLEISMNTASGPSPASVEWTLNYPSTDFSSATIVAGSAAAGAGKSVSCTSAAGSTTCVLWGDNSTPMLNGVVASVSLAVLGSTSDTSSQVQLAVPMAADPSGFPLTTGATGGTVTILQPAGLSGFSCFPISLTPPATSTCTLQLSAAAPSGGATVGLSASPADATLPGTISIPPGSTSVTFTVTPAAVTSTAAVNLSASYLGATEGFGLTINPPPAVLTGVTVSPGSLTNGQVASGLLTLSSPAPIGGAIISLASSNTLAATVPTSVMVLQGATTSAFTAQAGSVTAPTPVVVTGSYAGITLTANLTVNPAPITLTSITVNQSQFVGGITLSGTVTISAPAGASGVTVGLASSNTLIVTLPQSVTIPAGSTSATFSALTLPVITGTPVLLTATCAGVSITASLSVNPRPHPLNGIQISPSSIQGGQTATGTVTLGAAAGAGGVVVYLFSSNTSALTVPSTVTVPQGSTTGNFTVKAGTVTNNTNVAVTAYHAGLQYTTYVSVHSYQATYGRHRGHMTVNKQPATSSVAN